MTGQIKRIVLRWSGCREQIGTGKMVTKGIQMKREERSRGTPRTRPKDKGRK